MKKCFSFVVIAFLIFGFGKPLLAADKAPAPAAPPASPAAEEKDEVFFDGDDEAGVPGAEAADDEIALEADENAAETDAGDTDALDITDEDLGETPQK